MYTQITRGQAISKGNLDSIIHMCPSNINPANMCGICLVTTGREIRKIDVNSYKYYNCPDEKTGLGIKYYIE